MTTSTRAQKSTDRKAQQARIAAAQAEASKALADCKCPQCGQGVRRNLALTGWVQCDGYGAEGFRKRGSVPCSWQGFTQ